MTPHTGEALREVRIDAAPEGCPLCGYTEETGRRAVMRPGDPQTVAEGVPFTLNVAGDREETQTALQSLREHPRFTDLEVVNLTPYCMVVKARERDPDERSSPSLLASVQDRFGSDVIVDPYLVDEGRARLRALLTQPLTTRETLQEIQAIQEEGSWKAFQVQGVDEFDPREHAGLLRRILPPGQESLLRLAADMGYYETPKKCTLEDIGEEVGLSPSPVHKRLQASEQRLVNAFLDPGTVSPPETGVDTPEWVQNVARADGPMVEILARYSWEGSKLQEYMEAHPEARVVLHPFYDDRRRTGNTYLALAVGGDPRSFFEGAHDVPFIDEVEVVGEGDDHVVIRVETDGSGGSGTPPPNLRFTRRLGREAYLNPVYAEGGDIWLSVVTARHLTFQDVEDVLEEVGREVGWDEWDVVSIRPLEGRTGGGRRGELTDRQREVLDIARAMGYYRTPRESTLKDIADTLGVSENAVHKNLTAAERKIVRTYLDGSR